MKSIDNEEFKVQDDIQVVNHNFSERKKINPKYLSYIFLDLKIDDFLTKENLYLYSCSSVSNYWINQDVYDFYFNKFGSDSVELFIRGNPKSKKDYYIEEGARFKGIENKDFYGGLSNERNDLLYMQSNFHRYLELEEKTQKIELKINNPFFYIPLFFFLLFFTSFIIKKKRKYFFYK